MHERPSLHAPVSGPPSFGSIALPPLTEHARRRMAQRGIRAAQVAATLRHGRSRDIRGACIYVVGRQEARQARTRGVDLRAVEGIHVVCSPEGVILTVYRNKELNLREQARHRA